jgi:hypothetical protein
MLKGKGRPLKYAHFINILCDDLIYSPATIVRYGSELGLFDRKLKGGALKAAKVKVRHTLARLSCNRGFPHQGDGWTTIAGQAPLRGWLGARWKEAIRGRATTGFGSCGHLSRSCSSN